MHVVGMHSFTMCNCHLQITNRETDSTIKEFTHCKDMGQEDKEKDRDKSKYIKKYGQGSGDKSNIQGSGEMGKIT